MKKLMMFAIIAALTLICAMPAMAAGVYGRMNGGSIEISWQVGAGAGELTVYQNDWPVCVRNVNGSGNLSITVDDPSARYSLRLRTAEGCYTADVKGEGPSEAPTIKPTTVPTPEPTKVATTSPTQAPTLAPTMMPTQKPTQAPTLAPTMKPTQKPIQKPTQAPVSVVNRDDLATQVLNLVNAERASRGLGALRMDSELNRAACVRAGEITQVFSHTRPDGSAWSTVSPSAYGENIAKGQQTAEKVVAAWMTSTGHRENILRESYGSIGICAYKANGVMYWVQLFGR